MLYSLQDVDFLAKTPRQAFLEQYKDLYPDICKGDIDLIAIETRGIGALDGLQIILGKSHGNAIRINPHKDYRISGNPRTDKPWLLCDDTYISGETARNCAKALLLEGYKLEDGYVYSAFDMRIRRVRDILSAC